MRPFVIITVQTENNEFNYDIEAPTDIQVSQLKEDIFETLCNYNPKQKTIESPSKLYCRRLKRNLNDNETFGNAVIWSGDIIVLR